MWMWMCCMYVLKHLSLSTHSYSDLIWLTCEIFLNLVPFRVCVLCIWKQHQFNTLHILPQLQFNKFSMQFSTKYMCLNVVWCDWFVVHDRNLRTRYSDEKLHIQICYKRNIRQDWIECLDWSQHLLILMILFGLKLYEVSRLNVYGCHKVYNM